MTLSHHKMSRLRLKFDNVYATLDNLVAPNVTVISNYGYLNAIVNKGYPQAYMNVQ